MFRIYTVDHRRVGVEFPGKDGRDGDQGGVEAVHLLPSD